MSFATDSGGAVSLLDKFTVSEQEMNRHRRERVESGRALPGRAIGWRVTVTLPTLQRLQRSAGARQSVDLFATVLYLCLQRESRLRQSPCRETAGNGTSWYVAGRSMFAGLQAPSPHTLRRAITQLVEAGLIEATRRPGQRPRIRLVVPSTIETVPV